VPLSRGETRLAGVINAMPNVVGRTWEYWSMRLDHAGLLPPRSAPARKGSQSKAKSRPKKKVSGARRR
jgi:hypothetical protein